MRTDIAAAILDAFENPGGASSRARVSLAKARHFSTAFNAEHAASFAQEAGVHEAPLPQDGKMVGGMFWTVFANEGYLFLATSFMDPAQPLRAGAPLACDPFCRPALVGRNNTNLVIFYTFGTAIYKVEIDTGAFQAGQDCVTAAPALLYDPGKPCTLHALTPELVLALFVDDGGVRAARLAYAGAWTWREWGGRFIFPGESQQEGSGEAHARLNFSAAALLGNEAFLYITAPDGGVMGVILRTATGTWSDSFEVIPADLSVFAVANASTYNGTIYLCGQFQRVDMNALFISTYVYGLLAASTDGRTFSLDRWTAFSGGETEAANSPALRWMAGIAALTAPGYGLAEEGAAVIYSDANRWMALPAHFGITGEVKGTTIEPIISARGDLNGSLAIAIPNTDARYTGLIEPGDALDLDVGVQTVNDTTEWFRLMRLIVTGVKESFADGDVQIHVSARPLTAGRLDEMTHPFATHLQGRSSIRDGLEDFENFERAKDEGYITFPFAADFWDGPEGEIAPKHQGAGEEREFNTGDLKSALQLVDYPTIDALPFEIQLYGWSRSGNPTPYEGGDGDEPSDPDAPNDRMYCKLYIQRGNDIEARIIDTVQEGSENHFPQTWLATEAGSYPVILLAQESDDLQEGDQIIKVGMVFANDRTPHTAQTVFFPERVEMPTVSMRVDSFDETWEPVEPVENFPTRWNFAANNNGWFWENADEAGDPIVSYGWHYALGCRHQNCMQIDISTPEGSNTFPDGCGNSGPSQFASGAGRFSFNMPAPAIATTASKVIATVDIVFKNGVLANNGAARLGVIFTDGSAYQIDAISVGSGEEIIGEEISVTIPEGFAGKQVSKLGLIGYGRGYIVRFYSARIEGFVPLETEVNDSGQELMRVGAPVIFFAEKPYFAVNAMVTAKYHLAGPHAYGGVCLLASDGNNYVAARAAIDAVELIRVRSGLTTVLASAPHIWPSIYGWILLRYVDGVFEVRVKDHTSKVWSAPLITYEWTEGDGVLLTDPDVSHVGLYALLDAPYVRICGLDPSVAGRTGILPGAHRWEDFTESGTVRIEDAEYSYSSKADAAQVMGPYQGRNVSGPYGYNRDGASYSGNAAEFTRFEWVDNGDHADDFDGERMATDTGIVWEISKVDYKPTITTEGVTVFLKNRGRFFGPEVNGDVIGMQIAVWITHVLLGMQQTAGDPTTHGKGSVAYLVNESVVKVYEFAASSGYDDMTDRDAIDRITRIARGTARFPGDISVATKALSTTPWRVA